MYRGMDPGHTAVLFDTEKRINVISASSTGFIGSFADLSLRAAGCVIDGQGVGLQNLFL
jgi:RecG-like helicase